MNNGTIGVKMMMPRTLKTALVLLVATAASITGCDAGPQLVDQTQPNYLKKSELTEGTWYLQDTVVDVPSTSSVTFVGYQSKVEKVRFEVQEDYLVAYRTYEEFPGSDPTVDTKNSTIGNVVTIDGKPYRGQPVGAWKIQSHFDRIRDYTPSTGEQSNVLVENTTDRPWYERDFVRVNWAANSLTNWDSLSSNPQGWLNTYVQPIEDDRLEGDDALRMEKDANGQLSYFDFTVRQYWDPPSIEYPGYGTIPYCWLSPTHDCGGAVIRSRTSISRVDEAHVIDYEPLVYDNKLMKKFGYFRLGFNMERPTYDRNHGATLSGRLMYAQRHNIWKRAHDEQGNVIPVEKRDVKPIVYYLSDSYPKDLMESARGMEASWDRAFRRAVAVPRGVEMADVPQMFYVCENPVPAGAPAACGPQGRHVRLGDIRYHMLNWVDQPQMSGPLGYGPSGVDPETGEIIHAVANIYGAGIDNIGGTTLQLLDVQSGDVSLEDLIAGKDVDSFLVENRPATDPRRLDGPAQSKKGLTNDATQKSASFSAVKGDLKSKLEVFRQQGSLPLRKEDRRATVREIIRAHPELDGAITEDPEVRAMVLASAPGNAWRSRLMADPSLYRKVARETMLRMDEISSLHAAREDMASKKGIWLAEFSDGAYIWLAKDIKGHYQQRLVDHQAAGLSLEQAKVAARTDAWTRVRSGLNRFIAEHEVGHTLGLMHNFVATFDAMNYHDGYWDLRKQSIGVLASGKRVLPLTPQDLMDAAVPTQTQLEKGMATLQYSSVMDYTARFPNHGHGVGKYDEAAILFGYAGGGEPGWVEVFNETRGDGTAWNGVGDNAYTHSTYKVETTNMAKPLVVRGAHTEIPLAHVEHWTPASTFYSDRFHYTTLPFHFADQGLPFEAALDQGIARMENRSFRPWSQMKQVYASIEANLQEYYVNGGYWSDADWDRASEVISAVAATQPNNKVPVEVPFMYCSDYEVGANLACNRYDSGADFYEMTRDWVDRYNDYYAFSNFRRGRAFYNPDAVISGKFSRYNTNLPNVYQHWYFNLFSAQDYYKLSAQDMEQYVGAGDPIFQNYWTMGTFDGLNHLMGELSIPSAGYFGKDATSGRWVHLTQNNTQNTRLTTVDENALKDALTSGASPKFTDVVYVPRGPGRSMYTLFDNQGYDSFYRVNELGHFWDQYGALIALTSSETNFLGVDRGSDALRYSLPYYLTFPKELTATFSGVWLEDNASYASALVKQEDGTARVQKRAFIRGENFIEGFVYPPLPEGAEPIGTVGQPEPVEASPTWGSRFFTHLFGMAYFSSNFDQTFVTHNQVFRLGSGENIAPGPGFETVTFDDPFGGGYSYAALKSTTTGTQPSAAAWQVEQANALKTDWDYKVQQSQNQALTPAERAQWAMLAAEYEGKTREAVRNLEMMRGLYDIFGQTW